MKLNIIIILISSFFIISCAGNKNMQPRTVENYYTPTGVEKYFLTDIPNWANFDQLARCFRKTGIRYFNIDALMKSYALTYNQAIQVQASFNEEFSQFKRSDKSMISTLKEEELLFYKVSEKISSKIVFFDPPTFKRVNLIWLDEILGDAKKEKRLKKFLNSSVMEAGVPVLVSFCMTRDEVEKKFPDLNTKMITAELFSIYDGLGKMNPGFKFALDQFFKPEQKLYFYSQKKLETIDELIGTLEILNY